MNHFDFIDDGHPRSIVWIAKDNSKNNTKRKERLTWNYVFLLKDGGERRRSFISKPSER
jgi:hypothetical protein